MATKQHLDNDSNTVITL